MLIEGSRDPAHDRLMEQLIFALFTFAALVYALVERSSPSDNGELMYPDSDR